jgi:hypothetical protein
MTILAGLVNLSNSIQLFLSEISRIASGSDFLVDEQKFKLGGCVGACKTLISCANMSSTCKK